MAHHKPQYLYGEVCTLWCILLERVWRHLDMWQYKTFIKARIPRCKIADRKYASVQVPWADAGERMTDLLEKKR